MGQVVSRSCCNCGGLFEPDCRNRKRQVSCSSAECRRAMKAARQRRWLDKAENKNYFSVPEHVERVREWRLQHPGYWKRDGVKKRAPLQDAHMSQVVEKAADLKTPLQDALSNQSIVLIGLIAQISGFTLQDDMASTFANLLRIGRDILSMAEVSLNDSKTFNRSGARKTDSQTV